MKMTIDESISIFKNKGKYSLTEKENEAKRIAIDTMSKYQKIKEIMDELNGDFYGSYLKDRQSLEKIYEVLEDGSENNHHAPNC